MEISIEFIMLLATQILSAGVFIGGLIASIRGIEHQILRLEEKQDRHNHLLERMVAVEQSSKSAHNRLDELKRR